MTQTRTDVVVEVGENGNYHVVGPVQMVRISKIESEQGEPLSWQVDEDLGVVDEVWLCRCGASDNKPFCTDMHEKIGFDGTETAPTNSYAERLKVLGGTDVSIVDDRSICGHAGFCANRMTSAWKAAKIIDEDHELRDKLVAMLANCPSGALSVRRNGEPAEPELPVQIALERNGPIHLTGGIAVKRADGEPFETRNRVILCRCGQSSNKPLCDGSHKEAGFQG